MSERLNMNSRADVDLVQRKIRGRKGVLQDSISWKEKREMRLRYNAETDGYDELYSDEQRTKYELAFRRITDRQNGDWTLASRRLYALLCDGEKLIEADT